MYLAKDRSMLGVHVRFPLARSRNSMVWLTDPVYRWERLLRKCEYWENCHPGAVSFLYRIWLRRRFSRKSALLGFSVPLNVCGPGLAILHYGSVVISRHASIGENCILNSCVNIGAHPLSGGAPQIGNNVYIGSGAKLFGKITIADNVQIGANAVVRNDCFQQSALLVGVPAKAK